ncbi:MAG: glycosyl hydrolase [Phycisphaerae bacterium]
MKKAAAMLAVLLLFAGTLPAEEYPWQKISDPTAAELAAAFPAPPPEYSAQFDCGFSTSRSIGDIEALLDHAKAVHVQAVFVEPVRGKSPYLSAEYFDAVKTLVQEAKKRNMRLWFDDDGGYPSGFAGGRFTKDRPDLRSMALTSRHTPVTAGQQFTTTVSPQVICTLALNLDTHAAQLLQPSSNTIDWKVPDGHWEIVQPMWRYRSGPTRSANNGGGKTTEHSLMDYLDPEADHLFAHWTFDAYKAAIGDEFGKTVLGFRGDEPAYGFNPWSPALLEEFNKRKGYDLRPYLGDVAGITISSRADRSSGPVSLDEAHRAYADYCDVWSDLFGENFFGTEANWCAENHLEMQMHIEHEEILPMLAIADGDFFKCMRNIQVPGVDTIWHQIWHDEVADFPKLASSAAHLNGHPRAMCEAFAAYRPQPDIKEAGWILNHLMSLGINRVEYMGLQSIGPLHGFYADAGFPELSLHVNRTLYVLGEGRPTARIGVYIPSTSFWFKDEAANKAFLDIVHSLLQHQRDLDYVDEFAISKSLALRGKELVNLSGQSYRAILVPPVDAISKASLQKLHDFADSGGTVIFFGNSPRLVMDKNFLTATGPADISWATLEPTSDVTADVLHKLPEPDVATDQPTTWLRYNHRRLKDADLYFFFNEGEQPLSVNATVSSRTSARTVQRWDTYTGKIQPWTNATSRDGKTILPLQLPAWGTTLLVISKTP